MTPLLYRVFLIPLTVFFLGLWALPAMAQEASLSVKGISVDVTAESALTARNKAFTEARRKAYQQLAAQSVPASDLPNLVIPDDNVLASMVRDFEIVNEKMTSRRYVGTMDVRFNPAVRRSFQTAVTQPDVIPALPGTPDVTATAESSLPPLTDDVRTPIITGDDYVYSPKTGGVVALNSITGGAINAPAPNSVPASVQAVQPQVTSAPRPTLILPWYGSRGRQTLWGQTNPWRAAWEDNKGLASDKSLPILLPVGDVDDVRDYSPPQPLSQRGDIDALLKRYHATDAVLALAEPAEGGAIIVSLYRYESGSPVAMGRFGVDAGSGSDSMKQAVERAIVSLRAMPGASVQATQASIISNPNLSVPPLTSTASSMQFVTLARFSGLQQWVSMRNALSATPGISRVDVQSISPSQAQVRFDYSGDNGSLAALLAQKGLQLSALGNASITSTPGAGAPQYELTAIRSY